jgi:hypothetical protein
MTPTPLEVTCLLPAKLDFDLSVSAQALVDRMAGVAGPQDLHVKLGSDDVRSVPSSGYLIAPTDFEYAASWLAEADLGRVFLLGSEMPPAILPRLEQHVMMGAITAYDWFKVRDLDSHFMAHLRDEVAQKLGLERVEGFSSGHYGWYRSGFALPEFLVHYLAAFDEWTRGRGGD